MIYLHKLLPLIVSPLGLVFAGLLIVCVYRSRIIATVTFSFLVLVSMPYFGNLGWRYLERSSSLVIVDDIPEIETVVVLSGMLSSLLADDGSVVYHFNDSVNRFDLALQLLNAEKARQVIFTRGQMPWSTGQPEGDVLRDIAVERGIDPSKIILSDIASNTDAEAMQVAQLLGEGASVGLITSAFHMPRARMLFERYGLNVVDLPAGFRGSKLPPTVWDFVPSAAGLDLFSDFVRETIGRLYYSLLYA